MILAGKVLDGLDEFMQRLGHLTTLVLVARDSSTIHRIARGVEETLSSEVDADPADKALAEYLLNKKLVAKCGATADDEGRQFRYDSICAQVSTLPYLKPLLPTARLQVSWQDRCLAADTVRSKTGAIGGSGKSGSKSSISHIVDWAKKIGLINSVGSLSADGQVLAWLTDRYGFSGNPYEVSLERLVHGYLIFKEDFDLVSRIILAMCERGSIDKRGGIELYLSVVQDLCDDPQFDSLPGRDRQNLNSLWRDVYKGGKGRSGSASTAWHRVSTRLENLVDLRILSKCHDGADHRYEYKYFKNENTVRVSATLTQATSVGSWLQKHLVSAMIDGPVNQDPLSGVKLMEVLDDAIASIGVSVGFLPIDTLCLSIVGQLSCAGSAISLGAVRQSLETAARENPEVIRLSRGTYGPSAEFVSINRRRLAKS